MHRRLLEIPLPFGGYLPIYSYGAMLVVGFLAGIWLARRRARQEGLDPDIFTDIGVRAMIAGVVGARLFFVIENFRSFLPRPHEIFYIHRGGVVFFGGLLAVVAVLAHYLKKRKLKTARVFDIVAPALAIGLMFGRIGCFLNGCCFGDVCSPDMPFAVQFPKVVHHREIEGSPAFLYHANPAEDGGLGLIDKHKDDRSLPVHPTQAYSSACALALFVFLNWYFPRRKRDGDVALMFFTIYPCYRFVIEWLRDDNRPWFTGLTTSQNIAVVMFAVALWLWVLRRRGAGRPPEQDGEAPPASPARERGRRT